MSTDQWPPCGYDTQATGTGQLLACTRCGALVGTAEWAQEKHEGHHEDADIFHSWLTNLREALR